MVINIITAESEWIIYKFAKTVTDKLIELGFDARLSELFDPNADINHYFSPNNVGYSRSTRVDNHTTFMVTHVDTALKVDQIKELTERGALGICMSKETRDKLISYGVQGKRICYINPAQDGQILPKKTTLGFTHRLYSDCRKRDNMLVEICREIDPAVFRFAIMGAGWEKIVEEIEGMGFEVEYYSNFDKVKYNKLMLSLDYYCYFGFDEGSMGFLDAMAAGVKAIITPQGYHLDAGIDITYPVNTIADILDALHEIEEKRKKHIRFVNTWTWENYTLKHIEIWKYMLHLESLEALLCNRGKYLDGIFSLLIEDFSYYESLKSKIRKIKES